MSTKPTSESKSNSKPTIGEELNSDGSLLKSDQWMIDSLRTHLDSQADHLDFNTTSKLSAARRQALAQEPVGESNISFARSRLASWFNWTTVVGSTAVIAAAIFLGLQFNLMNPSQVGGPAEWTTENQVSQQMLIEDLNLLSASDDIEFYQSVEFLEWMESNSG